MFRTVINAVSEKEDTMAPTTDDSHSKQADLRAHSFTRRRFLTGLTGLILIAAEGSDLIQGAWAADQEAADKPFNKELIENFMRRAIELSRQGMEAGDGGPFGAVVVKGEKIIGEGWNRVIVTKDPTAHGEVVAIRAATRSLSDFNLKGCDLYTSAHPCPMCLGAIYWARIDRIYYANGGKDAAAIGFDDEFIYQQLSRPPHQRQVPEVQVLAEEAVQVFKSYAANPDRIRY
ncbi:MAG TPA: nucleoside deaminase [Nitrospiraceae bacterium]|nr:nucleoside deaminase [Nitrospiraceae bacterium]